MAYQQLTIDQIEQLNQISDPIARRRYAVLFQLPQDMQDVFVSENTTNSVWSIIKEKYGLSDRDTGRTARIIGLIFLGELPIKNFIVSLQKDLNIDVKTAQDIAQDINLSIFQPVRESLMQVHGLASDTNTRMHTNNANIRQEMPNYKQQIPNKYQARNNQISKTEIRQIPSGQTYAPIRPSVDEETQRRREEVLNKIKSRPIPPTIPAKPAFFRIAPQKNIIDLRLASTGKKKKKIRYYNGFFSA